MPIPDPVRQLAAARGLYLCRLPDPRPYGVTATPRGKIVATFCTLEGMEAWLHDQPVVVRTGT
jgi:hypothetical protein